MQILFVVYLIILLFFGLLSHRTSLLSWGMFSQASFCTANIVLNGKPISIWNYLPPTQVMFNKQTLQALLHHLEHKFDTHDIQGTATFYRATTTKEFLIKDANLIPATT